MISKFKRAVSRLKKEVVCYTINTYSEKVLFDHLPKCGGTTLNVYLGSHYPSKSTFTTNGLNPRESVAIFKSLPKSQRLGYSLVKGHLANELIDYVDPRCLVVTMLRDPVDRIVSHYYYAKRTKNHYLHQHIHAKGMSLLDYATSNLSSELCNWYTSHFSGIAPEELETHADQAISTAMETLANRYQIVGFLDDFASFINKLRDEAGLRFKFHPDNIRNTTNGRIQLDNLPTETIEAIERVNYIDMCFYQRAKANFG